MGYLGEGLKVRKGGWEMNKNGKTEVKKGRSDVGEAAGQCTVANLAPDHQRLP